MRASVDRTSESPAYKLLDHRHFLLDKPCNGAYSVSEINERRNTMTDFITLLISDILMHPVTYGFLLTFIVLTVTGCAAITGIGLKLFNGEPLNGRKEEKEITA